MTTIINGSSPSVTFSDGTTQTTAGLPLTGGTVTGNVTVSGAITATGGVIQGANAAPAFSAYLLSTQTITSSTWTKVQCGTEEFDTNGNYDNVTNYRFTPTVAGYYQFNGRISNGPSTSPSGAYVSIYKNGAAAKYGGSQALTSPQYDEGVNASVLIYMNGSTDYVELYAYITATTAVLQNGASLCFFQGFLARSA